MKQRRLLKLADYLETVPRENFDMGFWAKREFRGQECATTACAGGWATNVWPRHLQIVRAGDRQASVLHVASGRMNYGAVAEFFGLEYGEARALFAPGWFDFEETPAQVARRLRAFVVEQES